MFVSISDLQLRDFAFQLEMPSGTLDVPEEQFVQETALRASGVVHYRASTREILVRGSMAVTVSYPCDRCLERVNRPIQLSFDLAYLPEDSSPVEEEREVDAAEMEIAFYRGNGLDLVEVLREQVILDLPMRRVCEPACGNPPPASETESTRARDPRWSALEGYQPPGSQEP